MNDLEKYNTDIQEIKEEIKQLKEILTKMATTIATTQANELTKMINKILDNSKYTSYQQREMIQFLVETAKGKKPNTY